MNPNNSLFFMPLLVGIIFIIVGFIMLKFPPKKINSLYGYRTNSSMKSQNRWDYAQIYSSRLMAIIGLILCVFGFFGSFFNVTEQIGVLITLPIIFALVGFLIYKTETALKKEFKNEDITK